MTGVFIAFAVAAIVMAVTGFVLSRLTQSDLRHSSSAKDKQAETTATDSLADPYQQSDEQLIEAVNSRLPQTQCAQCNYPGCRPYAEAIINNEAPINQCPPGGEALIEDLAKLLGTQVIALDSNREETKPAQTAFIVESDCIGCALCLAACPVDAIVGAPRFMHTVISEQCTGCELCLPPCPVDCIELQLIEQPLHRWQWPRPEP